LVLSKIDLKNGAVGVMPDWPNAVVTSHFAVYEPDPNLVVPRYVQLLLQTGSFRDWLWATRSGADGRTEVKLAVFEDLSIPLPPLEEQRTLVAAHDAALAEAERLEAEAAEAERAGAEQFAEALGLVAPAPLPDRPLFVARFRDFDRWSPEAVLRRSVRGDEGEANWPMVRLGGVIADLENGWSPKCLSRPAEDGAWGVLKVSAATAGKFRSSENKALPSHLKPRPYLEVKAGQVLIARASGAAALVGTAAYVTESPAKLMLCDKLFRVVPRTEESIDLRYLTEAFSLPSVRQQIFGEFSTESGMMKNVSKPALLALTFPLPPLETQRELVAALADARSNAGALRNRAHEIRAAARAAFEAAIYA
jgi:type I restriction enzyme S subunit